MIAQATNLGVPFLLRVLVLLAMFAVAFGLMHDVGFTPERSTHPPPRDTGGTVCVDRERLEKPARALRDAGRPL